MTLKFGVVGYVPARYGTPHAFLSNMARFPTKHPLLLLSPVDYPGVKYRADLAEHALPGGHKTSAHNYAFLQCARAAKEMGWTHFLFVEDDCRVNCAGWDDILFRQFDHRNHLLSGTAQGWINGGQLDATPFWDWYLKAVITLSSGDYALPYNLGIRIWGGPWGDGSQVGKTILFPNGALSIMSVPFIDMLFDLDGDIMGKAKERYTWDYEIGIAMRKIFGTSAFEKVGVLKRVHSGYRDFTNKEKDRRAMLQNKEHGIVAVHHIKTNWEPT